MQWIDRALHRLGAGSALQSVRRAAGQNRRSARRRKLALEPLEPRLHLSAAGLVPVGAQPTGSLTGRIVYTSAGHGWQWSDTLGRWATDRGDNNEIVEDFGNQDQLTAYVDYLFRAGATVVPMRPVGRQINEVVLDNDLASVTYTGSWSNSTTGTRWYDEDYGAVADTVRYRFASVSATETATATYTPNIPAAGFYPVYTWVSPGTNRANQLYRINHTGGQTEVRVDHRNVGNGWVYLGTYHFNAGSSSAEGSVVISNQASSGSVVIADAIRFGNGMGDMPWGSGGIGTGNISGYPREDENSYLWLWRGIGLGITPTSVLGSGNVSAPSNMAQHMNQLSAANPFGNSVYIGFHSNAGGGRGAVGLIDTDAGDRTPNQASLALYTGRQINQDMQALGGVFEHDWSNRTTHTFTGQFGEIDLGTNAEMDATIIEVAFHDSVEDAQLMRDPKVRDQLARSTYQATLEYFQNHGGLASPVSLPTPPTDVRAVSSASGEVTVSWAAGVSTPASVYGAAATGFRIYASIDGNGFDGGTFVAGGGATSATLTGYDPSLSYYFRVVAVNAGGESKPSEVVTALPSGGAKQVLIVNGFDRFDRTQNFRYPYAFTGDGLVDRVWPRYNNSFDYVVQVHAAIAAAEPGLHVASTSNEAVISGAVDLTDYHTVIWILGEESTADSTFNATEQTKVEQFLAGGGNLFVSGSEIGFDLDQQNNGRTFYEGSLLANYVADDANTYTVSAAGGGIFAGLPNFTFTNGAQFSSLDGQLYNVDFPDVISPQAGAQAALNYVGGTGGGAAIQVPGSGGRGSIVMLAFPFEAITTAANRAAVLDRVFQFFNLSAAMPAVDIEFRVNGDDADASPGPTLAAGTSATFSYVVTNPGTVPLVNVEIIDDNGTPANPADDFAPTFTGGDTNGNSLLDPGETWSYSATRPVVAGPFTGSAMVTAEHNSQPLSDADVVNYFGSAPALSLETFVDGDDADTPPGPTLEAGSNVVFAYLVTNTGNVPLGGVEVLDDNGTPDEPSDDFLATHVSGDVNLNGLLDAGELWAFLAARTAVAGQYSSIATAVAQDSIPQFTFATDATHYFGGTSVADNADFNGDGSVDAADYVVWRKFQNTSVPPGSPGDANHDGQVDSVDYQIWQAQFGTSPTVGASLAAVESRAAATTTSERATDAALADPGFLAKPAVLAIPVSRLGETDVRGPVRPRSAAAPESKSAILLAAVTERRPSRDGQNESTMALDGGRSGEVGGVPPEDRLASGDDQLALPLDGPGSTRP